MCISFLLDEFIVYSSFYANVLSKRSVTAIESHFSSTKTMESHVLNSVDLQHWMQKTVVPLYWLSQAEI